MSSMSIYICGKRPALQTYIATYVYTQPMQAHSPYLYAYTLLCLLSLFMECCYSCVIQHIQPVGPTKGFTELQTCSLTHQSTPHAHISSSSHAGLFSNSCNAQLSGQNCGGVGIPTVRGGGIASILHQHLHVCSTSRKGAYV